ncbi:diguanylate cyclase domain-containing protein [Agrobacterium sp. NPDC058088]|uniref:diguanylate cyclase domain-containing protein n=1 Tax=Agrobacterium sp. NPDC058088 TaxID=3346335 RepID=UPI0036D79422
MRKEGVYKSRGYSEFAVYLRDVGLDDAHNCAERLRIAVRSTDFSDILGSRHVTVSFGVTAGEADWDHMYKVASAYLYEAKESGRNQTITGGVKAIWFRQRCLPSTTVRIQVRLGHPDCCRDGVTQDRSKYRPPQRRSKRNARKNRNSSWVFGTTGQKACSATTARNFAALPSKAETNDQIEIV